MTMSRVSCPDCDGRIDLNPNPELGQKVICPHCDAELEVIGLDPLEVDWVEDWTWDDDEDDDYDEDDDDW